MASKDELKRAVCEAIDRHADAIIELGETILRHPETGFNEAADRRPGRRADGRARPGAAHRSGADRGQGPARRAGCRARGSRLSPSSTACGPPTTRSPTRSPAPRTAAATTPRSPACWARRLALTDARIADASRRRNRLFRGAGRGIHRCRGAARPGRQRRDRVHARQARARRQGPFRRYRHGDDDPYRLAPTAAKRALGDRRVLERRAGQADPLYRPGGACRRRAAARHQRAQRGDDRDERDRRPARDLLGQGHDPHPPDHHQGRRRGQRRAGRGHDGDLCPRRLARGDHRRQPQGRPLPARRRHGDRRRGRDPHHPRLFAAAQRPAARADLRRQCRERFSAPASSRSAVTAPARPTWATSPI